MPTPPFNIESLIEAMRVPERATPLVNLAVAGLPSDIENYLDVALRAADVLLETPSHRTSGNELREWLFEVLPHSGSSHILRLRVLVTAMTTLQTHTIFPEKMEKFVGGIMEDVFRIWSIVPMAGIKDLNLPPQQRRMVEEHGWEVLGG